MKYRLHLIEPELAFQRKDQLQSKNVSHFLIDITPTLLPYPKVALIIGDEIQWDSTLFLLETAQAAHSITGDTVRTYGESLAVYLNFLNKNQIELEEVTEQLLQLFRNELLKKDDSGYVRRSSRTVNLRVSTASRFHYWGQITERFPSPLGSQLLALPAATNRKKSHQGRQSRLPGTSQILLRVEKKIPKILLRNELYELFATTPKPFSLMFKWAAITGLRRMELCNLKIADLPPINDRPSRQLREMKLRRKGGREVTVYLPNALLDETWWYVSTERRSAANKNTKTVFVSNNGQPVRRQYLSSVFRKFCAPIQPEATLHHLRHTFAVITLTYLQRRAERGDAINPLKTLQILMGHSSITSTEIYLRALDIHSESVESALHYLYGGQEDEKN
jgi:integrase